MPNQLLFQKIIPHITQDKGLYVTFGYVFGTEGISRDMLVIQFPIYSYQYIFIALEFCRLTRRFEAYGNVICVSFNSTPAISGAKRPSPFESPTKTHRMLLGIASPKDDLQIK